MTNRKTDGKRAVKLREKTLRDGSRSLYLDIYSGGRRRKEYLRIYLIKARKPFERMENRESLARARAIRAKREIELFSGNYSFEKAGRRRETFFLEYVGSLRDEYRGENKPGWFMWNSLLRYLEAYCGKKTALADVTPDFVRGFKKFLDKTEKRRARNPALGVGVPQYLAANTKHNYFAFLGICLNRAVAEGLLAENPMRRVKGFPQTETRREYLTVDELRRLDAAPCRGRGKVLKRAFLFSCLTGMRKSDVKNLVWSRVTRQGGFTRIVFRQKKTGGLEYLDINPQAMDYAGKRGGDGDLVFAGFPAHNKTIKKHLEAWCRDAGIKKKITFHSARHTFAVMMFEIGGDIYTVGKLLGHRNIKTTQIYTKVLDSKKRGLIERIPDFGGEESAL